MKLYKYRSLSNFEYTADILLNKKLYASHFKELNDPMEGIYSKLTNENKFFKKVEQKISKLRVCSMAQDMDNPILWAHYADSFKGICIEFEVDFKLVDYTEINYTPVTALVGIGSYFDGFKENGEIYNTQSTPKEWAKIILGNKFEEWKYENEVRLFSSNKYIESGIKITAVYLGMRISDTYKDILKKIIDDDIKIIQTKIDSMNQIIIR